MASASASPLSAPTTTTMTSSSTSPRPAPSSPDPDPDPDDSDPDDPIVETYHVLLKPELPAHQQLLVLQHPNRNVDYLSGATELRLKPTSGMVELDMPLGHSASYDRAKGVNWGKALAQANASRAGGAHGLAGGFGVGAPALRITAAEAKAGGVGGGRRGGGGGGGGGGDDDMEVVGGEVAAADFNEAIRRDKVLRTHTLGGQIATGDSQTRYMIGVFSGDNIHLTPITNLALLRPQLHHIDAKAELERATRRGAESGANGASSSGTGQGSGPGGSGSSGPAPRAVHMTVKSAGAVENDDSGAAGAEVTMADRLKAVQTEPWRRLAYVDESADDAWAVYEESLVHRGLDGAGGQRPAAAEDEDGDGDAKGNDEDKGKDKGKGKAKAAGDDDDNGDDDEVRLIDRVARLGTRWDETELLHVVSGLEVPRPEGGGADNEQAALPSAPASASASAAPAARRAAKPRAGASRATAMELD